MDGAPSAMPGASLAPQQCGKLRLQPLGEAARTASVSAESPVEQASPHSHGGLVRGAISKFATFYTTKRRAHHFQHAANTTGALSVRMRLTYAAPNLAYLPITVFISVWGFIFYETMGANLASVAFYIALARSIDSISDPAMAYISDACRSKWGRRRPFMASGCVPYALLLWLFWTPPFTSEDATSTWFGIIYILFYLANTYCSIPYDALAPELTDDDAARSLLYFTGNLFDGFGSLCVVLLPVVLSTMLEGDTPCAPEGRSMGSWCRNSSSFGLSCAVDRTMNARKV